MCIISLITKKCVTLSSTFSSWCALSVNACVACYKPNSEIQLLLDEIIAMLLYAL
jgi:hypothetical protein